MRVRPGIERMHDVTPQNTEKNGPPPVALIPGGARGIGRSIALDLARSGWSVAVLYRNSAEDAASLVRTITQSGGVAMAMRADVSFPDEAASAVERVEGHFGAIDALIHCAGPYHRIDVLEETVEGWNEMFDHNLHSLFYVTKAAAPGMQRRKRGRIIAFSMATADRVAAQPGVTAHFIAKMGVLVLVKSLARVLAPHGITANCISPGFIRSGSAPDAELDKMLKSIPAGAIGDMSSAVAAVRYLLSDEAAYVNGSNIHLSGAWGI